MPDTSCVCVCVVGVLGREREIEGEKGGEGREEGVGGLVWNGTAEAAFSSVMDQSDLCVCVCDECLSSVIISIGTCFADLAIKHGSYE